MAIYENGSIQYGMAMAMNARCTVNDTDMHYFKERDQTFNIVHKSSEKCMFVTL